ncbi:hypothetical protein [Sorangium cellulosum]|uniref:hypothetical protein n=1 Tax=Sorangium cellulosum TaxID=56 RepID=UPI0012DB4A91|nr:hypothetical protein [Sorangium cellulosum]
MAPRIRARWAKKEIVVFDNDRRYDLHQLRPSDSPHGDVDYITNGISHHRNPHDLHLHAGG